MSKFLIEALPGQLHGDVTSSDTTISGTFPTLLPASPQVDRKDFILQNTTGVNIWIGGSDVTMHTGIKVEVDGVFGGQLGRCKIYGVTAATTVSGVRIMEIV